MRPRYVVGSTLLVVAVLALFIAVTAGNRHGPVEPVARKASPVVSPEERLALLARAQVWHPPAEALGTARLGAAPQHPDLIECDFHVSELGGTARKFDCQLDNGEAIRVKYGSTPEVPAEVAAARLIHVLGFGADDVRLVERLRCRGCPADPFLTMKATDVTRTQGWFRRLVDYSRSRDFTWVSVERKHPGRPIRTDEVEGWAFFELDQVDAAKGGAPRAHLDALRLLAVFLAHWDNKSENQRLVCVPGETEADLAGCRRPLAMLQDVGSTFGPRKVDLPAWERTPVWADRQGCVIDMATLPYGGSTFAPLAISEAGRRHLATLLGELTRDQLIDLFRSARFDQPVGVLRGAPPTVDDWVRVFRAKVEAITAGPPCPS
jgi:hypothetical protein